MTAEAASSSPCDSGNHSATNSTNERSTPELVQHEPVESNDEEFIQSLPAVAHESIWYYLGRSDKQVHGPVSGAFILYWIAHKRMTMEVQIKRINDYAFYRLSDLVKMNGGKLPFIDASILNQYLTSRNFESPIMSPHPQAQDDNRNLHLMSPICTASQSSTNGSSTPLSLAPQPTNTPQTFLRAAPIRMAPTPIVDNNIAPLLEQRLPLPPISNIHQNQQPIKFVQCQTQTDLPEKADTREVSLSTDAAIMITAASQTPHHMAVSTNTQTDPPAKIHISLTTLAEALRPLLVEHNIELV